MSDSGLTHDSARLPADLSGRQVGGFHFLRRLGRGAMAEVYLAEQSQLKRWVAVKILRPELANDPAYLKRFEREAQAAASLVHANIVQIHEVGRAEGLHYIVQEYVQGLNLRDWLARNGPPLLQPALAIMRQIGSALAKAAEHGVIHRDIKPENIMITGSGEVKVADFGLARVVRDAEAAATSLTQVGITMGTPLYMSPEQVEGRALDHRSDLYSFGVLSYHLLTGKPPFVGETALSVAVQHVKSQPKPLEDQRPDLPPALCRVVHQMLAKDPEQRWQSCGELLRELYRIQLEHCPQSSPEELAAWGSAGFDTLTDPRRKAKEQLAEAMHRQEEGRSRIRPRRVAMAMALIFALSAGGAWWTLARPLSPSKQPANAQQDAELRQWFYGWLARQPGQGASSHAERPGIPQQDTELRQWFYASRIGTEEAWKSVIDYPGVSEYVRLRAMQQLGRVYLRADDLDHALPVFEELASTSANNQEFKAFGMAGKFGILSMQKKYRESSEVLNQMLEWRKYLRDNQMKQLVRRAIDTNRTHLGAATNEQWQQWLEREFTPEIE